MNSDNRKLLLVRMRYELKAPPTALGATGYAKRISWLLALQSASLLASWILGERRLGAVVTYASGAVLVALLVAFQAMRTHSSESSSYPLLGKRWGPFAVAAWTLGVMLVQLWIVGRPR